MRKLVTALALFAAFLWSVAVWGGYALLGWTGGFIASNAGALALPSEAAEIAAWTQLFAANFGHGAAMVLWLIGIGLIGIALLAVNLVLGRLVPAPRAQPTPRTAAPQPVEPPPRPAAPMWGREASKR